LKVWKKREASPDVCCALCEEFYVVKIVVDSTADIPAELRREFDIQVVPLQVRFGDETFRDGVDITQDEFYQRLVTSMVLPTTSTPPPGAFIEVYERLAQETDAILAIHLSGKLSSTVGVARKAAEMVPQVQIEVVDSHSLAMVMVYMAIAAGTAARNGAGLDTLLPLVTGVRDRAFFYVGLDTLHYLEKGGRIGRARAFLGTLLNVKPLVEVCDGEVQPLEQVRTSKRMMARLIELVQTQAPLEELALLYTSQREKAEALLEQIVAQQIFPRERIYLVQMGGVIGTHAGPGAVGVVGIRQAE
jgi:DegV family protein with EDD domain